MEVIRHSPSHARLPTTNSAATPWEGISVTKTHPRTWSALMAVVGVVLMLGASVASAAPTAQAMDPSAIAAVTVTVTPTILVSEAPNGELVTVGTIMPGTTEAGSSGPLVWIVVVLALVLAAAGAYWWLLFRRSTGHGGRRGETQP